MKEPHPFDLPIVLQPNRLFAFTASKLHCWVMSSLLCTETHRSVSAALHSNPPGSHLYCYLGLFQSMCTTSHSSPLKPCWARFQSVNASVWQLFLLMFFFSSQSCIISKPSISVFKHFTPIVYIDIEQFQTQCPSLRNSIHGQFQTWPWAISQQQLWAQQPSQFSTQLVALLWSMSTKVLRDTMTNDLLKLW